MTTGDDLIALIAGLPDEDKYVRRHILRTLISMDPGKVGNYLNELRSRLNLEKDFKALQLLADLFDLIKKRGDAQKARTTAANISLQPEDLIRELHKLGTGNRNAHQYEDLGTIILEYLFVPPLGEPKTQQRTENGLDIRDAILPNNTPNGFWSIMRNDHGAKYVVVDFKNYTKAINQDPLDRTSLYLKKTIGNFGMILTRKAPSMSAKNRQKQLFNENPPKVLLLADDDLTERMIRLRKINSLPESLLQEQLDELAMTT